MKQLNYTVVENPTKESPYESLIKALDLNPDKLIQIRCNDAHKQRLTLLQWLRRHGVKELYYTKIIDGKLYIGKINEAT
jgi:hypothetical protein